MDRLLGEPRRWHPLVGFGNIANWLENKYNSADSRSGKLAGFICWAILVLLSAAVIFALLQVLPAVFVFITNVLVIYFVVGLKSLAEHGRNVVSPLLSGDILEARRRIAMMVSRDTNNLSEQQVAAATCESVLENGSDAVLAALFWFLVLGSPGTLLFRFTNTLDAMWGYKNNRYRQFGWAAARADDILNWLPARLAALSYALVGNFSKSIKCSCEQGSKTDSPNAGYVMAAGAGALGITIGGAAYYHGEIQQRSLFGVGSAAESNDVARAISLVEHSAILWVVVVLLSGIPW